MGKVFTCDRCDYATTLSTNLKKHKWNHDPSQKILKYKCDYCVYRAADSYTIRRHNSAHTRVKLCACPEQDCNYRTDQRGTLETHLRTHNTATKGKGRDVYKCQLCHYRTKYQHNLNQHRRVHQVSKALACDKIGCEFRTRWAASLKRHRESHLSDVSSDLLPRPVTPQNFLQSNKISMVMVTHSESRSGQGQSRSASVELVQDNTELELTSHFPQVHEETSQLTTSFPCPSCPKIFAYSELLQVHVYIHTGEKPLKCPHQNCEFATHYSRGLERHVKAVHSEEQVPPVAL